MTSHRHPHQTGTVPKSPGISSARTPLPHCRQICILQAILSTLLFSHIDLLSIPRWVFQVPNGLLPSAGKVAFCTLTATVSAKLPFLKLRLVTQEHFSAAEQLPPFAQSLCGESTECTGALRERAGARKKPLPKWLHRVTGRAVRWTWHLKYSHKIPSESCRELVNTKEAAATMLAWPKTL